MAEVVELLLHGVADKHQRLHLANLRLALGMRENFSDLGVAAAAVDARHQFAELAALRNPAGSPALRNPAVIHELDVEAADAGRLLEHVGLQRAGGVPG